MIMEIIYEWGRVWNPPVRGQAWPHKGMLPPKMIYKIRFLPACQGWVGLYPCWGVAGDMGDIDLIHQ